MVMLRRWTDDMIWTGAYADTYAYTDADADAEQMNRWTYKHMS